MKEILMVSRAISPPWDEASRNFVKEIVSRSSGVNFHILTDRGGVFEREDIVEHRIYTSRDNSFSQKLKLLTFLIKNRNKFDVYHLCFTPEKITSMLIRMLIDKKKVIQSIPYLTQKVAKGRYTDLIHSSAVTVTSDSSREELSSCGVSNIKVVYPGVDTEVFRPDNDKEEAKGKFSLKAEKHVLWAGDLYSEEASKKIFLIIKDVCKREGNVNFVIACRIKEKAYIARRESLEERLKEEGLRERVLLMETVKDMPSLMSACDIFIYPLMGGFVRKIDIPYAVVEAMACGMPVVISDVSPINEVMKDASGVMVKGEDPLLISGEIKKLLSDDSLFKSASRGNRETAVRYFDVERMVKEIKEVYRTFDE